MFKDTAGTQPTAASESLIVLGEHDLTITTESKIPKKNVKVSQIINHPSYNADNSDNDISLLKLAEKIDLNVYTPACLPKSFDNFEGQKAWVYGKSETIDTTVIRLNFLRLGYHLFRRTNLRQTA